MPDCPACSGLRLHFADEWPEFHPDLWSKLTERQKERIRQSANTRSGPSDRETLPESAHQSSTGALAQAPSSQQERA